MVLYIYQHTWNTILCISWTRNYIGHPINSGWKKNNKMCGLYLTGVGCHSNSYNTNIFIVLHLSFIHLCRKKLYDLESLMVQSLFIYSCSHAWYMGIIVKPTRIHTFFFRKNCWTRIHTCLSSIRVTKIQISNIWVVMKSHKQQRKHTHTHM